MSEEQLAIALARLDERMEHVLTSLRQIEARLGEQNGRVRRLEAWRNLVAGGLIVLATLVGWGLSVILRVM